MKPKWAQVPDRLLAWSSSPVRAATLAVGLFAVLLTALRLVTPPVRVATVEIRTTFDGVDRGTYPNGVPFSAEELVTEPVLREVYKKRGLERAGDVAVFTGGFAVATENPELAKLEREALAELSDVRLGVVQRAQAEDDYRRSRASVLAQSKYVLVWRVPEAFQRLDADELKAVLNDVLDTWQRQVREVKKATQYDVPVLSSNVLELDVLQAEDYPIAADLLRAKVDRALAMVDRLVRLPGAGIIRGGKRQLSLEELRARLQDLRRFEITPLIVLAESNGLTRDPLRLRAFLQSRREQARYEMIEATARVSSLYGALVDYGGSSSNNRTAGPGSTPGTAAPNVPLTSRRADGGGAADDVAAIIPQFGDTFFTRLAETASKSSDVSYRQRFTDRIVQERDRLTELRKEATYYLELERAYARPRALGAPAVQRDFNERFARAVKTLGDTLDDIVAVYGELSARNLDPTPALYAVTRAAEVKTESVLVTSRLVMLALLGLAGALVVTFARRHWTSSLAVTSARHS